VTSAYVRTDSGGGGGESQDNPTGVGECHIFLAGNCTVLLDILAVFLAGNRLIIVAFEKEVSVKSLNLFSKTIVRQCCSFKLEKKHLISINGKKKFKKYW